MRAVDLAEGSLDGSIRAASGAQLVCQLPPRDVNRLAAGGRIQPRITIRVCATGATDPMWLPLLAATRCAHQLLHPLPLPTLPTCYCLNSAQRSRLSRCCRVAQPTDPGWPSLARLAADARMRCRLPGPSRQLRQADCLKPSFLLAPNRSADDPCQGCPQGITRDARSAPLTVIFCGSILGRREGCSTSSACPVGPGLGHGRPRWSAWLLTAPTLPWPEGPKAAGGARRGTDRRSGPALAAPYGCPGIPTPGI